MLKVGLTGGIGSGKSFVARVFMALGIPVYDSDEQAKVLMTENQDLLYRVKELFGDKAYTDKQLNRKYISERVFVDKQLLSELNAIVHPAVNDDFKSWARKKKNEAPYLIKEAAILIESGAYKLMDHNILVVAEKKTRISRVVARDNTSEESVIERMNNQMSDKEKMKSADFIIYNDIDSMILRQIVDLHQSIKNKQFS